MQIETERLLLIALTADNLLAMIRNRTAAVMELGWKCDSGELDSKMCYIYQLKAHNIELDQRNLPFYTYWAIILKENKLLLGDIGFKGKPDENGEIEIGYGLESESYYNQGYMSEAFKALINWAFSRDNVQQIVAETDAENLASQKVVQKCGLTFWKRKENYMWWKIENYTK